MSVLGVFRGFSPRNDGFLRLEMFNLTMFTCSFISLGFNLKVFFGFNNITPVNTDTFYGPFSVRINEI